MELPDPGNICDQSTLGSESSRPSCQGCKRRKLKCSREQPICSHCRRLESPCVYDPKKGKPGVKLGAVGSLSRRVEALEEALLHRPSEQPPCSQQAVSTPAREQFATHGLVEILSTLARELQKLNSRHAVEPLTERLGSTPNLNLETSPRTSLHSSPATVNSHATTAGGSDRPRKRRRVDSCGNPNVELASVLSQDLHDIRASLPSADLLEDVIDVYFDIIQPWIPVLHETRFRRRVQIQDDMPQLVVILHAMVVAAIRFVDNTCQTLQPQFIKEQVSRSRSFVRLKATESLSVENLQALIILAFTDIGNGDASQAWSLIGSLTRTVEYLQLGIELNDKSAESLLRPLLTMSPPSDWTVEEERRRVFWTIFCLDRYCSVTTGWNTSLTSDDVQRRLPADGGLWHKEEAVTTPFFGIWDKSAAKIGNSIAFLTGHYPSPEQTHEQSAATVPSTSSVNSSHPTIDMSSVGAFAYCIEATESLSRITTYFLQQKIDFRDRQQVSDWLVRFKELDLRLVHWKMFLPQRWKDSNISRQPEVVNMDPNLTLAHVTHNASMILLHQSIGYPKKQWTETFKLPSTCSADTCQVAAVETTIITQKYLKHTPKSHPVASQYAFCVYISARVLLIHWQFYKTGELAPEFWILLESLEQMARRWVGELSGLETLQCLAGKYAQQLKHLHQNCQLDKGYQIEVLGYTSDGAQVSTPGRLSGSQPITTPRDAAPTLEEQHSTDWPDRLNLTISSTTGSQTCSPQQTRTDQLLSADTLPANESLPLDRLSAISHALMDENFTAMDRIISLDDMIFNSQTGGSTLFSWMQDTGENVE